jgi:hypothetical protein
MWWRFLDKGRFPARNHIRILNTPASTLWFKTGQHSFLDSFIRYNFKYRDYLLGQKCVVVVPTLTRPIGVAKKPFWKRTEWFDRGATESYQETLDVLTQNLESQKGAFSSLGSPQHLTPSSSSAQDVGSPATTYLGFFKSAGT